jgi:hypothetical protein
MKVNTRGGGMEVPRKGKKQMEASKEERGGEDIE